MMNPLSMVTGMSSGIKGMFNNSVGQLGRQASSSMNAGANNMAARHASLDRAGGDGVKGLNQQSAMQTEQDNNEAVANASRIQVSATKKDLALGRLKQLGEEAKGIASMLKDMGKSSADIMR